jgi:ribonuclease-3
MPDTALAPLPPEVLALSAKLRQQAFTHRSLCARDLVHSETNERLEFLGDAVLELTISEYLFVHFPQLDEGSLTRYRSAMVKTESLAIVAEELNLGDNLLMSVGEEQSGGNHSPSILANTFESVVGALYLDKGYASAAAFIHEYLVPHFEEFTSKNDAKDAKTLLQETIQSQGKPAPTYDTVSAEGPDHAKTFTVEVSIAGYPPVQGTGASKQKAQQEAAAAFLKTHFPDEA